MDGRVEQRAASLVVSRGRNVWPLSLVVCHQLRSPGAQRVLLLVSITPSIQSTKRKAVQPDARFVTMETYNNVTRRPMAALGAPAFK